MIIHSVKLMETHFVSGTVLSEDLKKKCLSCYVCKKNYVINLKVETNDPNGKKNSLFDL